ncbi:acetate/propionate family kinase [Pseudoxanthobacter sp.]|uniref:acetate/propionate family kinase n=1 Tax=Pseudoxanthobacter sp. TaxID=1925742 RepID=UPI002FE3B30C
MGGSILVINAGSSSLKFELFAIGGGGLEPALSGYVSGIGTHPHLIVHTGTGDVVTDERFEAADVPDVEAAQDLVGAWIKPDMNLRAVGHRVVHGGALFSAPIRITPETIQQLESLVPLAPLHQGVNLAPIRSILRRRPDLPQVACFDTAFHRGHPEVADHLPLPEWLYDAGLRRYGFHGLSYEYIAERLQEVAPELARGRTIVAHLGSGCSMCAMVDGKSMESTMGFSTLDGLPMGTRPGQLDAGAVLWLIREKGMTPEAVEEMLYHECGLKGLSGLSGDIRDLMASDSPRAAFALDYFVYRVAMMAGALISVTGGIDGFVFTAGIGEKAPAIRARVVERLNYLGFRLDPEANAHNETLISTPYSKVKVLRVPTNEELMIARHTLALIGPE